MCREGGKLLDNDRIKVLTENAYKLYKTINTESGELLDCLVQKGVITEHDRSTVRK